MFFRLGVLATLDPVSFSLSPLSLGDTMRAAAAASGRGARIHWTPVSPQPPSSSLPSRPVPSVLVGRSVGVRAPRSVSWSVTSLPPSPSCCNMAERRSHSPARRVRKSSRGALGCSVPNGSNGFRSRCLSLPGTGACVSARPHTHCYTHALLHTHLRSSSLSPPLLQHG